MSQGTSNNVHALLCAFILCCSKSLRVEPLFSNFSHISCVAFCFARKLHLAKQWCVRDSGFRNEILGEISLSQLLQLTSNQNGKLVAPQKNAIQTSQPIAVMADLPDFSNTWPIRSGRNRINKSSMSKVWITQKASRTSLNVWFLTVDTKEIKRKSALKRFLRMPHSTNKPLVNSLSHGQWLSQGFERPCNDLTTEKCFPSQRSSEKLGS